MPISCLIIIIISKACNARVLLVLPQSCRCSYLCNRLELLQAARSGPHNNDNRNVFSGDHAAQITCT